MNSQLGVLAVVLLALGVGVLIGWVGAGGFGGQAQLAALEQQVAELGRATERAPAPQRRTGPDPDREYPVRTAGSPSLGPEDASVTIVEFTDYQCPFCGRVHPTMKKLLAEYEDDVRLVMKHNPLPIHPLAPTAARAAVAAGKQGKFWEMHERIFANQRNLADKDLRAHAEALGLDVQRWEKDRSSSEVASVVTGDQAEARRLGTTGTPAFFINGRFLSGAQPYDVFKQRIDEELKKQG